MKRQRPIVTDHAVVRYLERVYGVDIRALRRRIKSTTKAGRLAKAGAVQVDGVRYVLSQSGHVVSVDAGDREVTKRGLRWKARHK